MKKLENFSKAIIPGGKLNLITGGERDTGGGHYFFGRGKSVADCDPEDGSDWTYWFEDGSSIKGGAPAGSAGGGN